MTQNLAQWARTQIKPEDDIKLVVRGLKSVSDSESGEAAILGRLGDLGMASGETFQYFGKAPLGEPIYICVRETVVALRLTEAALILVSRL